MTTSAEANDGLVHELEERRRLLRELYLKGLTDFVKWTSTVAAGAILWIANNLATVPDQCRLLAVIALAFLVASLGSALWIGRLVLLTSKAEWDATDAAYAFYVLQEALRDTPLPTDPGALQILASGHKEVLDRFLGKSEAHLRRLESTASRFVLELHLFLLLVGLVTYACSQVYAVAAGSLSSLCP